MNFEYSPYILPLMAATIVSFLVAIYAWKRRTTNGALALVIMSLSIAEWTIGYSLEIAGTNLETKYFWGVIQYFGIALMPYGLLIFSISYNDQIKTLSRRFILLTALIPSITILLALTTKWHGLIWSKYHINQQGIFSALDVSYGMWFWVHFAYSYIILLIGTILLVRTLFNKQGMYRGQIIAMLIAVLTPWISNILYFTGNSPIPYLDPTPFAFTITIAAVAWAIFGFHLVDITPLARDRVVDSMREGMIVLNVRGNIVDINNAAARMIGVSVADAVGKTADDIFHPWSHLIEKFRNVMEAQDEISVGTGTAKRRYEARLSPLQDQQGQLVGRVIMLRAMEDKAPQPRFAAESTTPLHHVKPALQPEPELKNNISIIEWLINFFSASGKIDLVIPPDANPGWYQTSERSFTVIIRISAFLGTLAYVFTLPFVRGTALSNINIIYGIVIGLLWFLGLARKVNFRYRVVMFLSLLYISGFVETLNFGYSVESLIFFMTAIITSVLLIGRAGGWTTAGFSIITLGVFGFLIGKEGFVPFNLVTGVVAPRSFEAGMTSLAVFSASALAISTTITVLIESVNKAWQLETQALNLLQQERDLLEQRVEERTRDLAEATDSAIRSNTEFRKYYRAIEQSGNGIVITDVNGAIEYVNPKFEEISGYAMEEVVGKNPRILKSDRQRPEFYEKLWKTISSGKVWHGVFHNKKKDGSLYWDSATIAPVLDQNNIVVNYVAIKEDVTARRQSEEQLRKLSQAVEQSGNTVIIMDRNGLIEYVNPKFTEVTGYSSEEALGKPPISLMNGLDNEPDFTQDEWWLTVNAGQIWRGEFQNHRKDGAAFWESATIAPVHNRDGDIINFVEIKQDITEEKLLQEQLQKQNDYLSILHQVTLDLLNRRETNDLLQVIVDRSAILLDAPFSELMLEEDDDLITQALTNNLPNLKGDRVTRDEAKFTWQAFDTHQPVIIEDYSMLEHQSTTYYPQALRATADFPVMAGERCLGILALGRSQPNYRFTAEQIETGILFARLVALVLDNASLYESAMKEIVERKQVEEMLFNQNQYLAVLHKTTLDLLQSRDATLLLNTIVTQAAELVGAAHGYIFLSEGDDLVLQAATNKFASNIGNREKKPGSGVLKEVWQSMSPFVIKNYGEWEKRDPSYAKWNLHALAGIPIVGRDGPLGVLQVVRQEDDIRKFTAQEIEVFAQFASLVSLVLDNAQLDEQVQKELMERKRAEAQNEAFLRDIKALQEIHLELTETENIDELYIKMITQAQRRLGLDRVGLFIIDEHTRELRGTHGIGQDGQMRNESYYHEPITDDHWSLEIVNAHQHARLWENAPIFDDGQEVGHGWKSAAALWNGQKAIGYLVSDNFINHQPARPYEAEIISLLGSTFGHLIENKRNEIRLQESEVRFRQIVENASDIIYRTDIDGNFVYFNPTAVSILGYQHEDEILGKNYVDMAAPEWRHKLKRFYARQLMTKENNTYFEFPTINPSGEMVWLGQSVQIIKEGDEIIGFQAVARDITKLVQAREALAISYDRALDASRFKSQLLSRVSHELRTPLGVILGYTELLQGNIFGVLMEKQKSAISEILESTQFLTKTVNDLLDESQIEAKSLSLHNEYFFPSDLLSKVQTSMSVLAGKKNLGFHTEISPELPSEIYGDIHRLQQILINLAGNAIKFTKTGEVHISIQRPSPAQWSIVVSDTGAGIHPSEFERIFEPFRQVNNSITRENRGSGLGLAITKQLIELMGGQITVQSEIGKSSTFTVLLPINNAPGE